MVSPSWFEHDLPVLNLVIAASDRGEPADPAFIAEALALDAHTTSLIVDRLRDAGHLTASTATAPTVRRLVVPTPTGRKAAKSLPPSARETTARSRRRDTTAESTAVDKR